MSNDNPTVRSVHVHPLSGLSLDESATSNPRASPLEGSAKRVQSKRGQEAQADGQRLSRLDGAWNRATGEDDGSKQSKLDAVGVAVLDAQAAEDVQQTDRNACCDGGNRSGAEVACDTSASGEGTEKKSRVCERLACC